MSRVKVQCPDTTSMDWASLVKTSYVTLSMKTLCHNTYLVYQPYYRRKPSHFHPGQPLQKLHSDWSRCTWLKIAPWYALHEVLLLFLVNDPLQSLDNSFQQISLGKTVGSAGASSHPLTVENKLLLNIKEGMYAKIEK